jgi:hypothetical protein
MKIRARVIGLAVVTGAVVPFLVGGHAKATSACVPIGVRTVCVTTATDTPATGAVGASVSLVGPGATQNYLVAVSCYATDDDPQAELLYAVGSPGYDSRDLAGTQALC